MMFDHVKILTYFFTIYARSSVPPKPSVSIIISLHILYKRVEGNHHRILLDTYSLILTLEADRPTLPQLTHPRTSQVGRVSTAHGVWLSSR